MLIELKVLYTTFLNDALVWLYVAVLVTDNILGHIKAIRSKTWTSKVGINGILRHTAVFAVVFLMLPMVAYYLGDNTASNGVLLLIIGVYMVSIMENMTQLGFPLSDKVAQYFPQMKGHNEKDKEE